MSKEIYYKQCTLTRPIDKGTEETVSWLPECYSVVGMNLRLKDKETGNWTEGWTVKKASTDRLLEKFLPDPHKAIKGHRKATGDSQPRRSEDQ